MFHLLSIVFNLNFLIFVLVDTTRSLNHVLGKVKTIACHSTVVALNQCERTFDADI